jgi:phosphatidylglycerophosphatase A
MSWVRFLATGFYVGRIPFAPGTFGTLVAVPLAFLLGQAPPLVSMVVTVAAVFVSVYISELNERESGQHDQGEVVIDEIVGYLVTMLWLPPKWQFLLAGFVLFRFFDILKPYPIRAIDQRMKGGMGVVMDDVAAGIVANLILQIIFVKTSWLGVQWNLH